MLYKTIPIMERADGSLQIDTNKVTLTQGDYNFNINYFTKEDYSNVSPVVSVQVSFRRKDGQQTGWLPLQHIRGNQYIINLKSSWFTTVPGNMYITFRVFQTNSNNVNLIINTTSGTLVVNPTSAFNTPEPDIIPSEFEVYVSQTNDKFREVYGELSDLRNDLSLSQLGKGIFDNEQELLATYPNGADYPDGTWAVLLSTNTVWLYNSTTKTWYNSNRDVTEIFDLDDNVYRFAKQLYEESANIIETENASGTFGGVEYVSLDNKTTLNGTATSSGDIWLKLKYPIKAGTTFSFNQFANNSELNQGGIWLAKGINDWTNRVQVYGGKENISLNYDINYISIHLNSGTTYSSYYITPMAVLDSEKPTNYFRYNPNRHITNAQADLLKSEWEKSLNETRIIDTVTTKNGVTVSSTNGTITISGTPTTNQFGIYIDVISPVEIGTYSLQIKSNDSSFVFGYCDSNAATIISTKGNEVTSKTTTKKITKCYVWINKTNAIDVVITPMLVKGTYTNETMPSYQEWNGKLIHEKDITPVLLWSFGIDAIQESQNGLTIQSKQGYQYVIAEYQTYKGWNDVKKTIKFKLDNSNNIRLDINDGNNSNNHFFRRLTFVDNTTINIGAGYTNGTVDNAVCIIRALYGSNY